MQHLGDPKNNEVVPESIPREATIDDISTLVNFQIALANETENITLDLETVTKGVKAVFEDPTKGKYYVCEKEGKVVACLMTTFEWSDWRNGTVLWIQSVYVDKDFRGQRIYQTMYEHIKKVVTNNETLRGIRLYADKTNLAAIAVYNKLGMNNQHYELFEWMKGDF
jgi:ribosomal protein S18 acetylase RimI-like enzyme